MIEIPLRLPLVSRGSDACYNLLSVNSPLLQSLFDDIEPRAQSVSELTSDIKVALEGRFSNVWVEGEITNFHAHGSGHWYFSLTDGDAVIKAACFRGQNHRIRFKPTDGLQVRCRGRLSVYERRGDYQLMVESLEPVGEGALTVAFEQIKAKLNKEGLFDDEAKRPIPHYPRTIGIVTSPTGAALYDILTVLDRRARSVNIVVVPTQVQGETAGDQIAAAIRLANEYCEGCLDENKIDVLIVGRGGGSSEDLWAFNEERVARAIRASNIPVISAVGHEVDFTIADLAADLRAPTPSAAAEIVARAEAEIDEQLQRNFDDLLGSMNYRLLEAKSRMERAAMSRVFTEFPAKVRELGHVVDSLYIGAEFAVNNLIQTKTDQISETTSCLAPLRLAAKVAENKRLLSLLEHRSGSVALELTKARHQRLERTMARLDALSPLAVLTRGYSITQNASGDIVRNPHQTEAGERISVRLAGGSINALVEEVFEQEK
jgi:exodeoxyribonuclease VII large subunit